MHLDYHPLKQLPKITLSSPPPLGKEEKVSLGKAREMISSHDHWFDGKTLHVKKADPKTLELFEASYAWNLAQKNLPGLGGLSVSLLLENRKGQYLWQRRSSLVTLPHHWDLSVGGTVGEEDLENEIRKEALEELGQNDLPDLRVEGLGLIDDSKVDILFSAKWSGQCLKQNDEISGLYWGHEPPWPSLRGTRLVFRSFLLEKNRG